MNLTDFLSNTDPKLAKLIRAIAVAVSDISQQIKTVDIGQAGSTNQFGEKQLALDMLADKIIFGALKDSGVVATASSEEQAENIILRQAPSSAEATEDRQDDENMFSVAFDPLDGSSLVDVNLAIGTIFGIWPGDNLIGRTGAEQAAAGYAVYGPRTTLVLAVGDEVSEFILRPTGEWDLGAQNLQIGEGKMFAPGNLRATADNAGYKKLVEYWQTEKYTLRYSGGMVPDINQIILKGKGVFSYPGSESCPAKLRLLYECAPLAKVVETAGGASSDGNSSILTKEITTFDERTPICLGSRKEVERFEQYCG